MAEEEKGNGKKDEPSREFDNFQRLLKQVLSVPKEELDEKLAEEKREKKEKRAG